MNILESNTGFSISDRPKSGSKWLRREFKDIRSPRVQKTKSFMMPKVLKLFYQSLERVLGKQETFLLCLKAMSIGYTFYKPEWRPDQFELASPLQEKMYQKIFDKALFYFILFNILKEKYGDEKADKIIADTINPCTLEYMKQVYQPVDDCVGIEAWWQQSVDYIADLPEDNLGLDGTVYMAEDMSEIKWHTTRCATAEVFRAYGLKLTMSHMCMSDHITYHTFFPGIMFKRTHCIGVGDAFCDHHAWPKSFADIGNEESQYGDCHHFEGGRDYVRYWEAYAKEFVFGSQVEWQTYANRIYQRNSLPQESDKTI